MSYVTCQMCCFSQESTRGDLKMPAGDDVTDFMEELFSFNPPFVTHASYTELLPPGVALKITSHPDLCAVCI